MPLLLPPLFPGSIKRKGNVNSQNAYNSFNGARYWRLRFPSGSSSDYVGISEIEMRDTIGGTDRTTTTAFSSSSSGGWVASFAFNNNYSDQWYSAQNADVNAWISDDLTSSYDIAEMLVTRPLSNTDAYGPLDIVFEYSSDNIAWTTDTRWPIMSNLSWNTSSSGSVSGERKLIRRTGTPQVINYASVPATFTGSPGWNNYTLRLVCNQNAIPGEGGNRIKFAFAARGNNLTVSKTYIQKLSGIYGFSSAPVQVTWDNGSNSVTILDGNNKYCDDISLTFNSTDTLVISIYLAAGQNNIGNGTSDFNGQTAYYKTGDDAINQTPSGYTGYSVFPFVDMQVWTI